MLWAIGLFAMGVVFLAVYAYARDKRHDDHPFHQTAREYLNPRRDGLLMIAVAFFGLAMLVALFDKTFA